MPAGRSPRRWPSWPGARACPQAGVEFRAMSTEPAPPVPPARRSFRYVDLVMAGFVTVLLCSNLIGPGKSCRVELLGTTLVFGAGNLFFPISYIFDDVL